MVQNNLDEKSVVEQAESLSFPGSVVEFMQVSCRPVALQLHAMERPLCPCAVSRYEDASGPSRSRNDAGSALLDAKG